MGVKDADIKALASSPHSPVSHDHIFTSHSTLQTYLYLRQNGPDFKRPECGQEHRPSWCKFFRPNFLFLHSQIYLHLLGRRAARFLHSHLSSRNWKAQHHCLDSGGKQIYLPRSPFSKNNTYRLLYSCLAYCSSPGARCPHHHHGRHRSSRPRGVPHPSRRRSERQVRDSQRMGS